MANIATISGNIIASSSVDVTGNTIAATASFSTTASYVATASYAPNVYNTDGALTSDRIVTLNNFTMSFTDGIYTNEMYIGNRKGGDYDTYATIVGNNAALNSDGLEITAIGYEALKAGGGDSSTAIGAYALTDSTSGDNTAVGHGALENATNGSLLTAVGVSAGSGTTNTDSSIYIGSYAGSAVNGTGNIIIESKGLYGPYIGIGSGQYNTILGSGISGLASATSNNIILSDGQGNIRYRWDNVQNNISGSLAVTGSIVSTQNVSAATARINTVSSVQGALQVTSNGGGILVNTDNSNFAITVRNTASSNKKWDISPFNNNLAINESDSGSAMYFVAGGGVMVNSTNYAGFNFDVSGSGRFTNGLQVTGSLQAPSITGSLLGSATLLQNTGSNGFVSNMGDTYAGTAKITDIVTLTSAEYSAIGSPSTSTLYIVI